MATETLEGTDLSWVTFAETDEPIECIWPGCRASATGAIYIPQCGKHPMCKTHLEREKRYLLSFKGSVSLRCSIHHTVGNYKYNPAVFVG